MITISIETHFNTLHMADLGTRAEQTSLLISAIRHRVIFVQCVCLPTFLFVVSMFARNVVVLFMLGVAIMKISQAQQT
jgi:hypothetical protein